uniref:hypothetical protein n=1 Tax=Prevotella sp. TaxID=59823 RepID=UPI003FEEE269
MNKTAILFFVLLLSVGASAQSASSAIEQINKVKSDTSYISAETTMQTWDEAYSGAKAILEANIQDWAHANRIDSKDGTLMVKSNKNILEIKTNRGKYVRVFLYVRKSDIIPVDKKQDVMVIKSGDGATYKPLKESEAKRHDEKEMRKSNVKSQVIVLSDGNKKRASQVELNDEEKAFAAVSQFNSVKPIVERIRQDGRLIDYGKYKDMPSEGICYLFVYDKSGVVKAVLKRDSTMLNLRTQQEDDIDNYKGCGAIWLRMKQQHQ